ncbi:uncharacterized protein [Ptychodera flava]|uniref:uncharacterized protein isoform X1 n=1 Tax=Ptychodera flava TaxID=63121 RepID=UPI00396A7361
MTREVVVGLVANIKSAERRRLECETRGLPPEHPRAGTTDDVEGFFSILHSLLGRVFDHKAFRDNYRKICNEFAKRVNPDLPFYYWTGSEDRYTIGPIQNFNQPSKGGVERLDKIRIQRRSDPGVFQANRASLPQRGSWTVRARFHNLPEPVPPPPTLL